MPGAAWQMGGRGLKFIVFSDNHGKLGGMERVIRSHPECAAYIHLGDSEGALQTLRQNHPQLQFWAVRGNCDFGSEEPAEQTQQVEGHTLFFTHGHHYGAKFSTDHLWDKARQLGADVVLFGHSHTPCQEYREGVYLLNPGSIAHPKEGPPTYGVLDVRESGVLFSVAEVRG